MKIFDVYVAGPYSHFDDDIRQQRYHRLTDYASFLTLEGFCVFSPITHSHPMSYCGLDGGYDYWQSIDRRIILGCSELHVVTMTGWAESKGVNDEIYWATINNVPITLINPETYQPEEDQAARKYLTKKVKSAKMKLLNARRKTTRR